MSEISELKEAIVSLTGEMNQRFSDMDHRFDTMDKRFVAIDKRFVAIDKRFDAMDKRFDAMDKRFDTMDKRFDAMDKRFDRFESDVMNEFRDMAGVMGEIQAENCARFDRIEQRLDKVESDMKIRWITPDLVIRLEAVEETVAKHSEQLAKLTS